MEYNIIVSNKRHWLVSAHFQLENLPVDKHLYTCILLLAAISWVALIRIKLEVLRVTVALSISVPQDSQEDWSGGGGEEEEEEETQ